MLEASIAAVAVAGVAWDCWRRWLAHRSRDYEARLDAISADVAKFQAAALSAAEGAAKDIKFLREKLNGMELKRAGR